MSEQGGSIAGERGEPRSGPPPRSEQSSTASAPPSFYEEIGGHETFAAIVHRFYIEVAVRPTLRRLYPDADLGPAEQRLLMFLEQYWGGPRMYSERRGHPRLRMRHVHYVIGIRERDEWLAAMRVGLDEAKLTADQDERFWSYLVMAADSLVNSVGPAHAPIGDNERTGELFMLNPTAGLRVQTFPRRGPDDTNSRRGRIP